MTLISSCVECTNYEFRPESLTFNCEDPKGFLQSQWPINQKIYLAYRLIVALSFIAWLAADCIYEIRAFFGEHPSNYLIYATNWSFLLLTLTAVYSWTCTLYYSLRSGDCLDRQTFERMPVALKGLWLLKNLSYNSAIVVTASFWSYVAVLDESEILKTSMSQMKHTLNTVYVVVDVLISGTPFRILHLLYTIVLGSVYSLFNAIYFLNDGTILEGRHYAYNVLNWSKPSEAIVTCVLCVLMCVFAQIVLYELYKLRSTVYKRIFFGSDGVEKPDSEMQKIMGDVEAPAYQTMGDREEKGSLEPQ